MPRQAEHSGLEAVRPWLGPERRFTFRRAVVRFHTSPDLFSSAALDVGSARLLRMLERRGSPLSAAADRTLGVLDLGCGAGPLGLAIARALPCGSVRVAAGDRDRLAVAVTAFNARRNDLDPNGEAFRALDAGPGFEPARAAGVGPFDLIVSNVPAKVGESGLEHLLFGAGELLRPGGEIAFVHIAPLTELVDALRERFERAGGKVEVVEESAGKEHRALRWRFPEGLPVRPADDPLAPYRRSDAPSSVVLRGARPIRHAAVYDVEEFDTPHFRTPLLAKAVQDRFPPRPGEERLLVLHPAHGFLPLLLAHRREPAVLHWIGRDTLSLEQTARNVRATLEAWGLVAAIEHGEAPAHPLLTWLPAPPAGDEEGYDLIVGPLRWKEGPRAHAATLAHLARALRPGGRIVVAVSSGQVDSLRRLARKAGLRPGRDVRRRGFAAVPLAHDRREARRRGEDGSTRPVGQ